MSATLLNRDDHEYKCVTCGSSNVSIVRQDKANPRCKCNKCGFLFNGVDAERAGEAGAIPESSAETLASTDEPKRETVEDKITAPVPLYPELVSVQKSAQSLTIRNQPGLPRVPKYVFITKNRKLPQTEFTSDKDLKRTVFRWEHNELPYDVYELVPKKFDVELNIS